MVSRKEYILQQAERHGRKAVAVLPIFYPKELLTAMGVLAVEMWGPPGPPRSDEAGRIQSYVCAVVRNALAFLASGGADVVDGVLFPHTCDSLQGLATVAPDFGGWDKAVLRYTHPKGEERPSSRAMVAGELRVLAGGLEKLTGRPLESKRLTAAVALHREIDNVRAELLDRRAWLALSDAELYAVLRRGEWLWPEDHLAELRAVAATLADERQRAGAPVLVSGIVPEPMAILDALADAGAWVAADDYAAVGRRVVRRRAGQRDDPWETLVDLHFAAPPCPTRSADPQARLEHLGGLLERSGAAGVIVHTVKFCEPELFDVPLIQSWLQQRRVPLLVLESELEAELSGQTVTRLEAFVEMLGSAKGAA